MRRRLSLVSALAASVLGAALLVVPPAGAVSPDVVVSQAYGGGGNSGATYGHDFVELLNRGDAAVSLDGWSVQYASATGTGALGASASQLVELPAVTLEPGRALLVQGATGGAAGAPLPTPDVTDATPVNLSASAGKVAVVRQATGLGCNGGSSPCSAAQLAAVADLVGYGNANFFEGSAAAPTASNTAAVLRNGQGCTDTDDNAADFTSGTPAPRTSTTPAVDCDDPGDPGGVPARIHEIQGAAHRSPMTGDLVRDVPGVVTATSRNGFWFEDPAPDADDATSDGLFVFTSAAPTVAVGDAVEVAGRVAEFRPGGAAENLTTTELTGPMVAVLSSGSTLPVTVVGEGGRVPPPAVVEDDATGDVEAGGLVDPAEDGLDFHESLEGMRLTVASAVVTGPTNSFGEIPVVADGASVRTPRGGVLLREQDQNPERFVLDDALADTPTVEVGDELSPVTGVLDYSFGMTKLFVTATPGVVAGGLARESAGAAGADELAVATFNVENLDAADPQAKFDALAGLVVDHLASPDLLSLEEVQDDTGPVNDGTTDASATAGRLTDAIEAAGGPAYAYRDIDPVNNADGGEPGGNIRVGLLFRTDRGLAVVDRPGGDATTPVTVEPGPHLSASPARIDPANPAFANSRKPLAAEFTFRGRPLFVVANHFVSKSGDDPLYGRFQPPQRASETQRRAQAQAVHGFAADVLAEDPTADVVVLGDLNDFAWSEALQTLQGDLLHNLLAGLPEAERYSYVFEGNSQALDHILVSGHLRDTASPAYDVVHVNAEFADQASDHDPSVVRLALDGPPVLDSVGTDGPGACGEDAGLTVRFSDPAPGDTHEVTVDWGDGTTQTYADVTSPFTPAHEYASAGSYPVEVTVSDGSGTASGTTTAVVAYSVVAGGLLSPLDEERTFRDGEVVPVRVALRDCDGSAPSDLAPQVGVTGPAGDEPVTSPTTGGTTMAFHGPTARYTYLLATAPLSGPTARYRVTVTVSDTGQAVTGTFRLRR
ncbi:MAG: endonuclease/exonuclease/phosphatase family protein [Actinomycetes bacterium]